MTDPVKKIPSTIEEVEKRLEALEVKRDQVEGLSNDEIKDLRKRFFALKEKEAELKDDVDPPNEDSFLDWLFS